MSLRAWAARAARPRGIGAGIALVTGLGLTTNRLSAVPGPESALVLGLVLPAIAAALAARRVADARNARSEGPAGALLMLALEDAAWVLVAACLPLGAATVLVRLCDPWKGLAFLALGPAFSVFLAALAGLVAGGLLTRGGAFVATLVPIASIGLGFHRFLTTPAIHSYAHFVGYFPGTLYDERIAVTPELLTFRAVGLALAAALATFFAATYQPVSGRLVLANAHLRRRLLLLSALLAAVVVVAEARGADLGHRTTSESVRALLGTSLRSDRCVVHAPRELDAGTVRRLLEDCDFAVSRAETVLGVRQRSPMRAYFYRDAEEKRRAMGAGDIYIAKPWRGEVHLQLAGWPHPILAHEVAHVVAANAARGPFGIAATLGGFLPNPGLIEGLAVAVAWEETDGLDPHGSARALRALRRLPKLDTLMSLGFLSFPARDAYAAAGSFVRFVAETRGSGAVRAIYRAGSLEPLGAATDALEREWHAFLDRERIDPARLELGRARFQRKSVFDRPCPHVVATLRDQLGRDTTAGNLRRAIATCRSILAIDPDDLGTSVALVESLARAGRLREAEALRDDLAEAHAPDPFIAKADEALGDALWRSGAQAGAAERYRGALARTIGEDARRVLEVKALALDAGGVTAALVRRLVAPAPGRSATPALGVHVGHELALVREDGLGEYLAGRNLATDGSYDLATAPLTDALERGLPTETLRVETLRLLVTALVATRRYGDADERARDLAESETGAFEAAEWRARIAFLRSLSREAGEVR